MVKLAYVGAEYPDDHTDYPIIPVLKIHYKPIPFNEIKGTLVFTSKRGIIGLRMNNVKLTTESIFCIGDRTKEYLTKLYGLTCRTPEREDSESLSNLIISSGIKEVTLITSNDYSKNLVRKLQENNINVKITIVYESSRNLEIGPKDFEGYDSLLFGSSKSFIYTLEILGEMELRNRTLYAIGEPTKKTMTSHGFMPIQTFSKPNIREIISSILSK